MALLTLLLLLLLLLLLRLLPLVYPQCKVQWCPLWVPVQAQQQSRFLPCLRPPHKAWMRAKLLWRPCHAHQRRPKQSVYRNLRWLLATGVDWADGFGRLAMDLGGWVQVCAGSGGGQRHDNGEGLEAGGQGPAPGGLRHLVP